MRGAQIDHKLEQSIFLSIRAFVPSTFSASIDDAFRTLTGWNLRFPPRRPHELARDSCASFPPLTLGLRPRGGSGSGDSPVGSGSSRNCIIAVRVVLVFR